MLTRPASRALSIAQHYVDGVASRAELRSAGVDADEVETHVEAGRWRTVGLAVILQNGRVSVRQRRRICLLNSGPQAVFTSFTAAQEWGLRRWERNEVHVAVPMGGELSTLRHPLLRGLVRHQVRHWDRMHIDHRRRLHALAPALVLAASSFSSPRPGCGLLAAAVQQRLATPAELRQALRVAIRARHRRLLLLAVADVEQGAEALSEIDLGRLCRRFGLPAPTRQAVRVEPGGRRRYLDAEWQLPDGTRVAVEVDGAHHMRAEQWNDDMMRQNEIVVGGTVVLRYPAVMVRDAPAVVAAQLARALRADGKGLVAV